MAAAKKPTATVAMGAAAGHREGLQAMRDKLAAAMDSAPDAVVAQIAGQLRQVLDRLAALERELPPEVSKVDELAARRQGGVAASDSRSSSGRRREVRGS